MLKPPKTTHKSSKRGSKQIRTSGVYVWGSGRFGQLGFEDVADKRTPTLQTILESLIQKQNEKIQDSNKKQSHSKPSRSCLVQLAAGGNCTAVIHELNGVSHIYMFGRNDMGQLGLVKEPNNKIVSVPMLLTNLTDKKIIRVSCGGTHTLALSESGVCWCWGDNQHGQLGLGIDFLKATGLPPTQVKFFVRLQKKIQDIATGTTFSAFLDEQRRLYTCGLNTWGQLGLGDTVSRYEPTLIQSFNEQVSQFSCGDSHAAAIVGGKLYTWGCGELFRLGHSSETNELLPRLVEYFVDHSLVVQQVTCGSTHTAALTDEGDLYLWGTGKYGELGQGSVITKKKPSLMAELNGITFRCVKVSNGYSAAISDSGQLYTWGNGSDWRLGHGSESIEKFPRKVSTLSDFVVFDIQLGINHCVAFVDNGKEERNKYIMNVLAQEKQYVRNLGVVCRIISPVIEAIVGIENWKLIISTFHEIYQYHKTRIVSQLMERINQIYPHKREIKIADIYRQALEDPSLLKIYTEYCTNFAKGWQRFLECLSAISNLSTSLKKMFGYAEVLNTGLVKSKGGSEQLNVFLELPLKYFKELFKNFQDLATRTSQNTSEGKILAEVFVKIKEVSEMVTNSVSNTTFVKFLDFLKLFPDHQYLLQAHRRYVDSFDFSITENSTNKSHSLVLFNDILVVVKDCDTKRPNIDHIFPLAEVFVQEVRIQTSPSFILIGRGRTYTILLEKEETKTLLLQVLNETIAKWIESDPKIKEMRIKAGIDLVVHALQSVMPLINRDWKRESELPKQEFQMSRDLDTLHSLFLKTASTLEQETHRRNRGLTESFEQMEPFIVSLPLTSIKRTRIPRTNYPKSPRYSMNLDTEESLSRRISKTSLLSSESPRTPHDFPVRAPFIRMKVNGSETVHLARLRFYNAVKQSPWVDFADLNEPVHKYTLKIKALDVYLTYDSLPLNRIPIIQSIFTTTFVVPYLEFVPIQNTKNVQLAASIDKEVHSFEDLLSIIGELPPFLNTTNEEINRFRRAAARFRVVSHELRKINEEQRTLISSGTSDHVTDNSLTNTNVSHHNNTNQSATNQSNKVPVEASPLTLAVLAHSSKIFPEYKGLEPIPLVLPQTVKLSVLLPPLPDNSAPEETYEMEFEPTQTIDEIKEAIFVYMCKKEKREKRKVHLPKFMKELTVQTIKTPSDLTTEEGETLKDYSSDSESLKSDSSISFNDPKDDTSESSTSIENEQDIKHQILAHDLLDKLPAISLDSKEELSSDSSPNTRILTPLAKKHKEIVSNEECKLSMESNKDADSLEQKPNITSEQKNTKQSKDEKPLSDKISKDKLRALSNESIFSKMESNNEEKMKSKGSPLTKRLKDSTKKQTDSPLPSTGGKNNRDTPKKEKETVGQDMKTPQSQSQNSSRKRPKLKSHQTILGEIQRMINEASDKGEEQQQQQQQQTLKEPLQLPVLTPPAPPIGEVTHSSEIKKKKFGSTFSLKHNTSDEEEKKLKKERKREKKAQKEQKHLEKKRQLEKEWLERKRIRQAKRQRRELRKHLERKVQLPKRESGTSLYTRLSNGYTQHDFVLKVHGSNEFFLGNNPLLAYDHVRKCINQGSVVRLKLVEIPSLDFRHIQDDNEPSLFDKAIAEEVIEEDIDLDAAAISMTTSSSGNINVQHKQLKTNMEKFASLGDVSTPFKIRVLDCADVKPDSEGRKVCLFVAFGIYHGGQLLPKEKRRMTRTVPFATTPTWNQDITFDTPVCSLPLESRLLITLYGRTEINNTSNEILNSDIPLAWVNCTLFDFKQRARSGFVTLKLWDTSPVEPNPIGTCSENEWSTNPVTIFLELFVPIEEDTNLEKKQRRTRTKETKQKHVKIKSMSSDEDVLTPQEEVFLQQILNRDPLDQLRDNNEKELLWKHRKWCKANPNSLPWLLRAIDWTNRQQVQYIHKALERWPALPPLQALQLLDYQWADQKVRSYAVKCLEALSDNDLFKLLLQLVQAVKFESYHDSALARFLIERASKDQLRIGHSLFWLLKSELHIPTVSERFSLLLEAYFKYCGKTMRQQLMEENSVFMDKLYKIALEVKKETHHKLRKTKLQDLLKQTEWPTKWRLPLDPRIECSGFIIEKCRVFGSKTVPLWLAFKNSETGDPINIIYKVGDDLRQDVFTLQIINLIDSLWKQEGLDLHLKPYGCMALGDNFGIIEVVPHANTTSNINIELGGVRAVYSKDTLVKWLKKHNPTEQQYRRAVQNFILSCAGYTVITFVLGLADRHNDNIMLTKDGHLFHIDFGHFLGHYRKLMGAIYADKADLVFIDQYYAIIGKENYQYFVDLCCKAYNVIRKHANFFLILFSLMLASGLPELTRIEDVAFLKDRLQLNLTDAAAADYFEEKLKQNRDAKTILFNHAFHVMYHGMRNG